jgi:tetratricopeptide (TPR) repeat protein
MTPVDPPPFKLRLIAWLPFVLSAALVALAIHLALGSPGLGLVFFVLALAIYLPELRARARVRRILLSGDVEAVLKAWDAAIERVPHRETVAPLMLATAFAANGMIERARSALERARRGDAWDAAIEHRLFVETLLEAFDGDRQRAVSTAEMLERLPLPAAGPFVVARIVLLRTALGALARAFAHAARAGDAELLERAAQKSPLVHWAMRYAAAVIHIDRGEPRKAEKLLEHAPDWPTDSAFRSFHSELCAEAAQSSGAGSS